MKGLNMTFIRPHRDQSYEIFLQGIDACKLKSRRAPPDHLDATGDDSDAALWLAGYDMEREERQDLARAGYSSWRDQWARDHASPQFMDYDIPIWD